MDKRGEPFLGHPYQLNLSTVSAGVWKTPFLRFHNAVNGGKMRNYFETFFKNDVLRPLYTKILENLGGKRQ